MCWTSGGSAHIWTSAWRGLLSFESHTGVSHVCRRLSTGLLPKLQTRSSGPCANSCLRVLSLLQSLPKFVAAPGKGISPRQGLRYGRHCS